MVLCTIDIYFAEESEKTLGLFNNSISLNETTDIYDYNYNFKYYNTHANADAKYSNSKL